MTHELETTDKIFGKNTEFHRFGLICAVLLITGCLGGIAVGLGGVNSVVALTILVIPMMVTLSLLLAVSPMKYILGAGTISVEIDLTPPDIPSVSGTTPTNDTTPTWTLTSTGGGNGTFRYKLYDSDFTSGATETTDKSYAPVTSLSEGSHTLYLQERDEAGNWSDTGSWAILIDITPPSAPIT